MRGDSQNHSMSEEVIDKILDEVGAIGHLLFTGGEPFLEPEIIDYIVDGIIKRKIPIVNFGAVTNGTIKSEQIINSFNKLSEYAVTNFDINKVDKKQLRTIGRITISNDDFHNKLDLMETLKYYRERLNEHCIIVKETPKTEIEYIHYLGNAKTLKLKPNQRFSYPITPYRVSFGEESISTDIQIGWDGKILIGEDSSYEQQDKNNYGNILDNNITTLLINGAFEEPFSEEEARRHDFIYTMYKNKTYKDDYDEEYCKAFLQFFEMVYCEREKIHKTFPKLPYDTIVETSYHDLNIALKDKFGKDFDFYRIDGSEKFNKSYEESAKWLSYIKHEYPVDYLIGYLKYNNKKIEDIPDKITRERYKKFE